MDLPFLVLLSTKSVFLIEGGSTRIGSDVRGGWRGSMDG